MINKTCKMHVVKGSGHNTNCYMPMDIPPYPSEMDDTFKATTGVSSKSETSIVDGIMSFVKNIGSQDVNLLFGDLSVSADEASPMRGRQSHQWERQVPVNPIAYPPFYGCQSGHVATPQNPGELSTAGVIGHCRGSGTSNGYGYHFPTPRPNFLHDYRFQTDQIGSAHTDNPAVRPTWRNFQPIADQYYQPNLMECNQHAATLAKVTPKPERCNPLVNFNGPPVRPILGGWRPLDRPLPPGAERAPVGHPNDYDRAARYPQTSTGPPRFSAINRKKNTPTPDRTLWYHCDICDCNVNSEYQFKIHTEGIKHRKRQSSLHKTSTRGPGSFSYHNNPLPSESHLTPDPGRQRIETPQSVLLQQNIPHLLQLTDLNYTPPKVFDASELAWTLNQSDNLWPLRNRYDSDSEYFTGSDIDSVISDI